MKRCFAVLVFTIVLQVYTNGSNNNHKHTETNIVLETPTGKLFGTLSLPEAFKKGPAVLLIAGSGPTDRDGNNPMMKNNSLLQLAHALSDSGIAVLRYDKRGIAESSAAGVAESKLRFEDYVNDAIAWVNELKKDSRFSSISIAGHSEGSLIGMIASKNNAASFISISGAGQAAGNIIKEQLIAQPDMVKEPAYDIIDSLRAGVTVSDVPSFLNALFRESVQPYMISWFRYDPQEEIAKLSIPVLIVQGTKDLQVSVDDADLLAKANPKAQLRFIKDMNHILKTIAGDRSENLKSYSDPALLIPATLVSSMVGFLKGK